MPKSPASHPRDVLGDHGDHDWTGVRVVGNGSVRDCAPVGILESVVIMMIMVTMVLNLGIGCNQAILCYRECRVWRPWM